MTAIEGESRPAAGSFLAMIDSESRGVLLGEGSRRRFASQAVLFHQGDPSTHLVLLLTGWVKVSVTSRNGYEALLAIRGPGDLVGELSAIDGRARSATVVTLQQVECMSLTAETFVDLLGNRPKLTLALLRYLAGRLREADRRRLEFGALSVTQRLAGRLLALAEQHGVDTPAGRLIDIPLSQRDLAGSIGASREAVARAFRVLREREVVVTRRQRIVIERPRVLVSIADAGSVDAAGGAAHRSWWPVPRPR